MEAKLLKSICIFYIKVTEQNGEVFYVPQDPANSDYQEIQKQVKEGTLTIKDAE